MRDDIVVGVDGSQHSDAALRWAVDEAKARGAAVRAVHAWMYPYVGEYAYMATAHLDLATVEQHAKETLTHSVERVLDPDDTNVPVEMRSIEGPAAHVLLAQAADASLLVVGSRGRGGFAGLALGSTSQYCVQHVHCPVVVVRDAHCE